MSTVLEPPVKTESGDQSIADAGPACGNHSEVFCKRQQAAWERYAQLAMPARTDEAWRFADVKALDIRAFQPVRPVDAVTRDSLVARSAGIAETAGRMVFANDCLLAQNPCAEDLQSQGVLWLPLEQAIAEKPELIAKYFMQEPNVLGSAKFAALHESQVKAGTFLYVPRGVEIALPFETFHWQAGGNMAVFPHTLIVAEENSRLTLVDYFESGDEQPALAIGVNDIAAAAGAQVTYIAVQKWNAKTLAFHLNNTITERDASSLALMLNLGGGYVRTESASRLRGRGARSDMLSIGAVSESQVLDQRTLQIHEAPDTASDLLYKNALNGRARTIFTGLIRVEPGAHKTDAYQKVRNLLLSDEAEANSAPGLEIEADDVRCSHGATTGQVDAEQMFYLQSRGVSPEVARQLIVFGFLNEVLERLPSESLQDELRKLLARQFR